MIERPVESITYKPDAREMKIDAVQTSSRTYDFGSLADPSKSLARSIGALTAT